LRKTIVLSVPDHALTKMGDSASHTDRPSTVFPAPRDDRASVLAARRRPMSERLALALAWDELASELRVGMRRALADRPR